MRGVLVVGAIAVALSATGVSPGARPKKPADSEELRRLMVEDQADRQSKAIDWAAVAPRDRARLARVKELYASGTIRTAEDYYHAALVLQHGEAPEDFLLAHGFRQVRVRAHGDLARVECDPSEIHRLMESPLREALVARLLELGFRQVTVDLEGYRMGSLNPKR